MSATVVLSVRNVSTTFFTYAGEVRAVRDVNFDLRKGEMLGLVGETGCGKSVLVHSLMNQVRFPGRIVSGEVLLDSIDLVKLDEPDLLGLRGRQIATIGSNPGASLDPLATIGTQLARALAAHEKLSKPVIEKRVLDALQAVGIPDPGRRKDSYPHEMSVGMAQRVLIAMALLHSPDVIIADEPTAGLDVTVQRQVLNLMKELLARLGSATLIVTRDLGIVAQYCDRVAVMRAGELVESTPVEEFFEQPREQYSRDLLGRVLASSGSRSPVAKTVPRAVRRPQVQAESSLLEVRNLVKYFPVRGSRSDVVHAVNGVSFDLGRGEALGLVGESGSGKTTIGRLIMRLIDPTSGSIVFDGKTISDEKESKVRLLRSRMQMVFQEPHASLNPTQSVTRNIEEPLRVRRLSGGARRARVQEVLDIVRLGSEAAHKYPHQLSAGQAQRVGIARAIATEPELVVLDEPTSQLDIAIRADIIQVLMDIREELKIAYLFISHDLTAVKSVCSRIAIMYLGRVVEIGTTDDLFDGQRHPYSKALLTSVLYPDPDAHLPDFRLEGEIPSPIHLPRGCHLYDRCPLATHECLDFYPPLEEKVPGWDAACFHSNELIDASVINHPREVLP